MGRYEVPATTPCSLIAYASEWLAPGSVPRSVITPAYHRKACRAEPVSLVPTTTPESFMAAAVVSPDPPSVPRSVTVYRGGSAHGRRRRTGQQE